MNMNERMIKIAQASPVMLEQIDNLLEGRPASAGNIDLRTVNFKEAAKSLGVSRPTIYKIVQNREIETVLIGGLERIPLRNLVEYATRPARRAIRRT